MQQKSSEELNLNPIQLETAAVLDTIIEGKYRLFNTTPGDDSRFAVSGYNETTGQSEGGARCFRLNDNGDIVLMADLDTDMPDSPTTDALHFGVFMLSYPSLMSTSDDDNQNSEFVHQAHAMIHAGEDIGYVFPIHVTIRAIRACAKAHNIIPR